jgi:hypothetical protein
MSSDNPTGADDQQETASAVDGVERVARLAYSRNAVGEQRSRSLEAVLMGSSETARQAPPEQGGEDTVRPSWRHEESGRNDLTAFSGHVSPN